MQNLARIFYFRDHNSMTMTPIIHLFIYLLYILKSIKKATGFIQQWKNPIDFIKIIPGGTLTVHLNMVLRVTPTVLVWVVLVDVTELMVDVRL